MQKNIKCIFVGFERPWNSEAPREYLQNKKEKSRTTTDISEFEDIRNNLCFFWDARQLESCLIPLNLVGKIYLIYGNI